MVALRQRRHADRQERAPSPCISHGRQSAERNEQMRCRARRRNTRTRHPVVIQCPLGPVHETQPALRPGQATLPALHPTANAGHPPPRRQRQHRLPAGPRRHLHEARDRQAQPAHRADKQAVRHMAREI